MWKKNHLPSVTTKATKRIFPNLPRESFYSLPETAKPRSFLATRHVPAPRLPTLPGVFHRCRKQANIRFALLVAKERAMASDASALKQTSPPFYRHDHAPETYLVCGTCQFVTAFGANWGTDKSGLGKLGEYLGKINLWNSLSLRCQVFLSATECWLTIKHSITDKCTRITPLPRLSSQICFNLIQKLGTVIQIS